MNINIRIGQTVIECEESLAYAAGYSPPYSNDATRTARGGHERSYGHGILLTPNQALAIALSEGCEGEMAVMRAIAVRCGHASAARIAHDEHVSAQSRSAAAQAELRAEQIRSARQKRENDS